MKWERLERKHLVSLAVALLFFTFFFSAFTSDVFADPMGANATEVSTSRGPAPGVSNLTAQAGNVSQVNINQTAVTGKWQGYYGNVTGKLTLESGAGSAFYDWNLTSPTGEIFASRLESPTWGSIACAGAAQITAEEAGFNISTTDSDSINSTYYLGGNHSLFSVGTTDFTADQCLWRTNAYVSGASQNASFDQIILYDAVLPIYTTIINQDTTGFDDSNWDFELLVPVNTTASGTVYFFFAELV